MSLLKVTVQRASNLPDVDFRGKSDPYVKVSFQGKEYKTEVIDDNLDPEWTDKNVFEWDLAGQPLAPDASLNVLVKDYDKIGRNKLLGQVDIPLRDLIRNQEHRIEDNYDLVSGKKKPTPGKIQLLLEYTPPPSKDEGGDGGEEEGGEEGGGGGEEDEDEEAGGEPAVPGQPGKPGRPGSKRTRRKAGRKRGARQWSTKVQDYQIRIRILEGRRLPGSNIHPVVRVTCADQTKESTVKKSTKKPVYNETFFYNFQKSEAELFDELIQFEVFNSLKLRSDALLGFFVLDIGSVYESKGHAIIRKWVLLTGPAGEEDEEPEVEGKEGAAQSKKAKSRSSGGSSAGYLKVTAMVLGPGDNPPAAAKAEPKDDEDDIEANCLMPVGVARQPGIFKLKVYQAEDIPQMDAGTMQSFKKFFSFFGSKEDEEKGNEDLVDPYLTFSFCGRKEQTTTHYHEDCPEFKEALQLPIMFPSMCERLKIQMFDWDRATSDDCIGTAFISLSSISGQGEETEGFLPSFGPCFVNFYGSTREFSNLPDEHDDLNKGIGEGVAYRGRALVELETVLTDEPIKNSVSPIDDEDVVMVQPYLRRDKFKLFACFYEATMVADMDGPVEFEVSIGNCGNKFDESVAPSNTPPCNTVFDGTHYHYLPWGHEKPCVCVDSSWENIAFRLEPRNLLTRMAERLESNLARLKREIDDVPSDQEDNVYKMIASLLDNFLGECRNELHRFKTEIPELEGKRNKLDRQTQQMRVDELTMMIEDIADQQWRMTPPPPPPPPPEPVETDGGEGGEEVIQEEGPERREEEEEEEEEREDDDDDETLESQKVEEEEEEEEWEPPMIQELVGEIEGYCQRLRDLAVEPQNCMPDVVIWMICGDKRVAYYRVPAYDVLFSTTAEARGQFCGKTIELMLKYPGKKGQDLKEHPEVPALVRLELWLGLQNDQHNWTAREKTEGEFIVYAESYENEMKIIKWIGPKGPGSRPRFSDASGDLELPLDKFHVPPGWKFVSDWQIKPELSLFCDTDTGHKTFLEEVFENQSRLFPGAEWGPTKEPWSDAAGDGAPPPDQRQPPSGWIWTMQTWEVDKNRAVDGDGWEYALNPLNAVYTPVEKAFHLTRRRRLIRKRELKDPSASSAKKQDQMRELLKEGWGYAPTFFMKFHMKEKKMDFVRRRRYLRELKPEGGKIDGKKCALPPLLRVQVKGDKAESAICLLPRLFVNFKKPHKFQLWAYMYQARDLIAKDESGMNDAYARVVFENQSQVTEILKKNLCPTWDQTLIFSQVDIYEDIENIKRAPPSVVVELFDNDEVGKDDFLGRCTMKPLVRLKGVELPEPKLLWHTIMRGDKCAGEMLMCCELFLDEGAAIPHPPSLRGKVFPVADRVRPVMQRKAVEILCWGVRNMKKFQLVKVKSPILEFEIGGTTFTSEKIKNVKKTPNFPNPVLARQILILPKEDMYAPPINIRVRDDRPFGRKPLVAITSLKSLKKFECKMEPDGENELEIQVEGNNRPLRRSLLPLLQNEAQCESSLMKMQVPQASAPPEQPASGPGQPAPKKPAPEDDKNKVKGSEDQFDWWSKFHSSLSGREASADRPKDKASGKKLKKLLPLISSGSQDQDSRDHVQKYLDKGYDTVTVFDRELEKMDQFERLNDFIGAYPLRRGKTKSKDDEDDSYVGEFKGSFRIYPVPDDCVDGAGLPDSMFVNLPPSDPQECIVRVYIICGVELQPQDPSGLADPYLIVSLGKKKYDEQDNYIPNSLNPVFGKMFQFNANIPVAKDLKIKLMDYDLLSRDDLIGQTTIDLEQRLLSRYHANCGLAKTYCTSGDHQWRDSEKPLKILKKWCENKRKSISVFKGQSNNPDRIVIEDRVYTLDEFETDDVVLPPAKELGPALQRLALHILHSQGLVPEHIETRSLYSPVQPEIEQGKVQMWVDIFPKSIGTPGFPVDIAPREANKYELRVIVWNTSAVVLEETSITGDQMSDIYVKSWIGGINEKQKTDVHYRSLDGTGNFNWRMVFPFEFLPIEKKLSIKKKKHFWSLDETEEKIPPKLHIQIWDNDTFSHDDFLGEKELDLCKIPKPCSDPDKCGTSRDPENKGEFINLFVQKSTRGWWACWKDGCEKPQGKVEMTIELLTSSQASMKPAGVGQEEPNQNPKLDPPNRPETSFLWFANPLKTFRYIIWRKYKWLIIGLLLVLLLIAFVVLLLYSMPGYSIKKLFGV